MENRYINWKVFFLCYFLGIFGVHRFYQGKYTTGFLMFFTLGGALLWWIIDLCRIGYHLTKKRKAEAETRALAETEAKKLAKAEAETRALAETEAKKLAKAEAETRALDKAKIAGYNSIQEHDNAKAKAEAEARAYAKAKKLAKAEAETKALALVSKKYGKNVAKGYSSKTVTLDMPMSLVEEFKGSGHNRKRTTSKSGEEIKEKYGKYFKKLSSGETTTTPSFEMEVTYERANDESSWLVSSFRDL